MPHVGQTPCVAGLPFFMVIALASFISFLARHFIQYACIRFASFLTECSANDKLSTLMMSIVSLELHFLALSNGVIFQSLLLKRKERDSELRLGYFQQ